VGLGAALSTGTSPASPALVNATVTAASATILGEAAAAGAISGPVAVLTEGMVRAMFLTKLKMAATLILALVVAGSGTGWLALDGLAQDASVKSDVEKPAKYKQPSAKTSQPSDPMVDAAFAKETLQPYVPLSAGMFVIRRLPAATAEGWVTKDELNGIVKDQRMLKAALGKGKPLTVDDLYDPTKDALLGVLRAGEIAKTVALDPLQSGGDRFIQPGCRVDIEATTKVATADGPKNLTQIILQNIEVFATNTKPPPGFADDGRFRVILRLNREDALLLGAYDDGASSLRLLLRAKDDDKKYEIKPLQTPDMAERLGQLLQQLLRERRTDAQIIEALYLAGQSRLPTEAERKKAIDRLDAAGNREKAITDLLQALTKSK
jgi:Flp pilus assembly protein CpaB